MEQPGLAARRLYWPRGRLIGGSTSLNAMMYHHCSPSDFDEWASVHGCEGWSFNDLAPYLRRMECLLQIQHALRSILSTVGLRAVGKPEYSGYLRSSRMVIPACQDAGIPRRAEDVNTNGTLECHSISNIHRSERATLIPCHHVYKDRILALRVMLMLRVFFSIASVQRTYSHRRRASDEPRGALLWAHARREVILWGHS